MLNSRSKHGPHVWIVAIIQAPPTAWHLHRALALCNLLPRRVLRILRQHPRRCIPGDMPASAVAYSPRAHLASGQGFDVDTLGRSPGPGARLLFDAGGISTICLVVSHAGNGRATGIRKSELLTARGGRVSGHDARHGPGPRPPDDASPAVLECTLHGPAQRDRRGAAAALGAVFKLLAPRKPGGALRLIALFERVPSLYLTISGGAVPWRAFFIRLPLAAADRTCVLRAASADAHRGQRPPRLWGICLGHRPRACRPRQDACHWRGALGAPRAARGLTACLGPPAWVTCPRTFRPCARPPGWRAPAPLITGAPGSAAPRDRLPPPGGAQSRIAQSIPHAIDGPEPAFVSEEALIVDWSDGEVTATRCGLGCA